MNIDATLSDDIAKMRYVTAINTGKVATRIASFAMCLKPHETFMSHLGVGDVNVMRLPMSLVLRIDWNDINESTSEVHVLTNQSREAVSAQFTTALNRYLVPSLIDDDIDLGENNE